MLIGFLVFIGVDNVFYGMNSLVGIVLFGWCFIISIGSVLFGIGMNGFNL